jgi:hypothetical protein
MMTYVFVVQIIYNTLSAFRYGKASKYEGWWLRNSQTEMEAKMEVGAS